MEITTYNINRKLDNKIKEQDLVMLAIHTKYGYSNTWWRVMFVDLDGTFIGKLEKRNPMAYHHHKMGEHVRLYIDEIKHIYKKGDQICYGSSLVVCDCEGLCRNKY